MNRAKHQTRRLLGLVLLGIVIIMPDLDAQISKEAKTQWFEEARFGMFIHFGLYSIPAGVWEGEIMGRNMYAEWIQKQGNWPHGIPEADYLALTRQFNPVNFDADEWIREAKLAGMNYFLITAKHHDGFALWPSAVTDFDIVDATPFKRDILEELAEACRKYGLKLGFYYSHWQDWHHEGGAHPPLSFGSPQPHAQPSDKDFGKYWESICLPQVAELIDRYDPAFFWFDTWTHTDLITEKRLSDLIGLVRDKSPDCLINSRIMARDPDIMQKVDYYSMMDNHFPDESVGMPWETSGTMNKSWGYHQLDQSWDSSRELLQKLLSNASLGGNFQLNVGPMGDGRFPKPAIRRLREVGAWLEVNGEAVFGTEPGPLQRTGWGYSTRRELDEEHTRIYLFVTEPPENNILKIGKIHWNPGKVFVLETGEELDYEPDHAWAWNIHLPNVSWDHTIMVLVMDVENGSIIED